MFLFTSFKPSVSHKLLLHIFAMFIRQRMAPSTQQLKDQDDVLTLKVKQGIDIFCWRGWCLYIITFIGGWVIFCDKLLYVRFLVHGFGFWRNILFIEGMSGIQTTGPQTTNSQLAADTCHTQIWILSIQHFSQKWTAWYIMVSTHYAQRWLIPVDTLNLKDHPWYQHVSTGLRNPQRFEPDPTGPSTP